LFPYEIDYLFRAGLVACIGDEDTVTGMLLAGTGDRDKDGRLNFLVVSGSKFSLNSLFSIFSASGFDVHFVCFTATTTEEIRAKFKEFTQERTDIAIVIVTQIIADKIRDLILSYQKTIPSILEIPDKSNAYDESKDTLMQRILQLKVEESKTLTIFTSSCGLFFYLVYLLVFRGKNEGLACCY